MPNGSTDSGKPIEQLQEYHVRPGPAYNNDAIPPALLIPLHLVNINHRGRKLRLIGQVLHYNLRKAICILSSHSPQQNSQYPTLLVDLSVPLLANSPSVKDISLSSMRKYSMASQHEVHNNAQETTENKRGKEQAWDISRELLSLRKGQWVSVVGWLEDGSEAVQKFHAFGQYAPLPPVILEAIHIQPSKGFPTPLTKLRGEISAWNGKRTLDTNNLEGDCQDAIQEEIVFWEDDWESTPKPKKANRSH
ncbi:uncharacterized protein L203_100090 [Cryptococcus depauperatus CBS 7841]|uniref:Uncharacterized protein n=1 Tax=Cryptococcus depauperatus CBS 7841 TaxID=1295531 RepID=A0A1E3J1R9_9TREE|nr:hypothetical protein L203_00251 [Cryptococcus depauperatus CBS 7841]